MKKNKKKKLFVGGLLGTAGQMAGGGLSMDDGSLMSSAAGTIGMINPAIGAGMAVVGGIQKHKAQKKAMESFYEKRNLQWSQDHAATEPTLPTFQFGGDMMDNADVVGGGRLEKISPDAVEVKANNPSKTDSVELDQAFVDHNEIIDKKDRVFSDSLKTPSGRTVAKEAKRLEKMKSKNDRFAAANSRIDEKLDELFNYQERLNKARLKPTFAFGGAIPPEDPIKPPVKGTSIKGPQYTPFDPNAVPAQQEMVAQNNLGIAQRFKNRLTGPQGNLIPTGDTEVTAIMNPQASHSAYQQPGGGRRIYETVDPQTIMKADSTINASRQFLFPKKKLNDGGFLPKPFKFDFDPEAAQIDPRALFQKQQQPFDFGSVDLNPDGTQGKVDLTGGNPANTNWSFTQPGMTGVGTMSSNPQSTGPNLKKIGGIAGQFGPDLINAALTTRMKKLKAPAKESRVFLDRINANDQLASNARQATNTNALIKNTTANASQALNNIGSVAAKRMYADNQVRGEVNRQNADIQAREAMINSSIGARNTERTNAKNAADVEFQNAKLSSLSQVSSSIGEKFMRSKQEANVKDLAYAQLDVLKKKYEDSGVYDRALEERLKALEDQQNGVKPKKKYGGKMKNGRKC
jgi:hypothetical protein